MDNWTLRKLFLRFKLSRYSIVGKDCVARSFSREFRLRNKSPFINLFIVGTELFFSSIPNMKQSMSCKLEFIHADNSIFLEEMKGYNTYNKYPIARLGDPNIEVHFLHYSSVEKAKRRWNHRCKRMNFKKMIYVGFSEELENREHKIFAKSICAYDGRIDINKNNERKSFPCESMLKNDPKNNFQKEHHHGYFVRVLVPLLEDPEFLACLNGFLLTK